MSEQRTPRVGEPLIWTDAVGVDHDALATAVWTPTCINVVIVSSDESKTDQYGRQIERHTSQTHKSVNNVHGYYWRFPDEEKNPYVPPLER